MRRDLLVPLSILAAGALIASAVWFAPRERAADSLVKAAESIERVPAREPAPAPPPAAASPELRAKVAAQAAEALEAARPRIRSACWDPAIRVAPTPAKATYRYSLSFDPQGTQVGLGINEIRGESRPDVTSCLARQPLDLRVPPPGAHVPGLELTLTLP